MTPEMQTISAIIEAGAPMALEQIIRMEIDEWRRSEELKLMQLGEDYYAGEQAILKRRRQVIGDAGRMVEDRNLANKRLIHMFVQKLTDQKTDYLLAKLPSVQTANKSYAEALADYFDKAFWRKLKNIGRDAVNCGIGWLHVYYDDAGKLSFKSLPPPEIIPLWADAAHTELDALIRVYKVDYYRGRTKTEITKVEYWDRTGVRRYVLDAPGAAGLHPDTEAGDYTGHFVAQGAEAEQEMNWERLPFIAFKYNALEQPLIGRLKSLVDDYDEQRSDSSNNLTDLPNGVYVLKDYDGQNLGEFRKNLSQYRAVKVTGEGGVSTLTLEMNPAAMQQHIEQLRKDIYEFGRGVDTQSERFGGAPSGIALKFLFADLDLDANNIENEFQAALEQLVWFVDQHLVNTGAGDFADEPIEFIFNRDMPVNETDTITNIKNSVGLLSTETLVAQHPYTGDAAEELDRLKKEQKEQLASYGGLPDDDGAGGG